MHNYGVGITVTEPVIRESGSCPILTQSDEKNGEGTAHTEEEKKESTIKNVVSSERGGGNLGSTPTQNAGG